MQGFACLLGIVAVIVPCVLGFVNLDSRVDTVEKGMSKNSEDVEENEDAIHALELVDKGLTVQYQEILRRQGEMLSEIKNLTRVD
jgi:hypothetical protein|tara:strand:- start:1410 stop:1664 length:255 start_codon:yes stop_codon:yes gene_type:complete